jgi:hypothetical protein
VVFAALLSEIHSCLKQSITTNKHALIAERARQIKIIPRIIFGNFLETFEGTDH